MIFLKLLTPMGIDFRVYYESAYMLWHGLNPYFGILSSPFPLNYPPPVFFLIWPLGLFPMSVAAPIWNISSTLALIASIFLVLKMLATKVRWPIFAGAVFLFTLPFFPVKFNIGNGQINHFILFFSVFGLYLYSCSRRIPAALFLALAASIKLAPLIFLLYFAVRRDYHQILLTLTFLLVIFVLPVLFLGWPFQERYYREIIWYSFNTASKDWYYNQSLSGFLARAFRSQSLALWLYYVSAPIILLITFLRARKLNWRRALAGISALYLLIHPIALQHYFSFAAIPLILLWADTTADRSLKGNSKLALWAAMIIAYLFLALDIKNFWQVPKTFAFILSHDFYAVLILWLLALWRERFWTIISVIWIAAVLVAYILTITCRASLCL